MKFPSLEQVEALHHLLIVQTGGAHGLRDRGALESAVVQPRMSFGGRELYPSLAEKAAALSFSLVSNHPFVDGNKRIGFATGVAFLRANGHDISSPIDEAEQIVLKLAAGELSREEWTSWVRDHIVELKS
jgi:death-on-curing protein